MGEDNAQTGLAVMKIHMLARKPEYTEDDPAGATIFAVRSEIIQPLGKGSVSTGIALEFPEGTHGMLVAVQAQTWKGIHVNNSILTPPMTDNIEVRMFNTSDTAVHIRAGEAVAQVICTPTLTPNIGITMEEKVERTLQRTKETEERNQLRMNEEIRRKTEKKKAKGYERHLNKIRTKRAMRELTMQLEGNRRRIIEAEIVEVVPWELSTDLEVLSNPPPCMTAKAIATKLKFKHWEDFETFVAANVELEGIQRETPEDETVREYREYRTYRQEMDAIARYLAASSPWSVKAEAGKGGQEKKGEKEKKGRAEGPERN